MNVSGRWILFACLLITILLLTFLLWPFILGEIIKPISIVLWLLLRVFVLSIDQKYYWGAVIFILVFFLYRFLPQSQAVAQDDSPQDWNSTMRNVGYWHSMFTFIDQKIFDEKNLKKELIRLLIAYYATKQRTTVNFTLYEALQQGELPLPEHIRAYLFPKEIENEQKSLRKRIRAWMDAPKKWLRNLTGQDIVEHNRMIDEVLGFMEAALEMKNDNGKFKPS